METVTVSELRNLSRVHLFRNVSEEDRNKIADRCRWHAYEKEEQIIGAEEEDKDVYFLVKGLLRVVNYGMNGKEVSFIEIPGGNCFGEMSAIDNKPRSAMVMALEPSLVASISAEAFKQMLLDYPVVAWAVLQQVTAIARGASERIMRLSTTSANHRVYNEILRQANEAVAKKPDAETIVLSPAPLHSDIAARVSTTRETVARAFSSLVRKGILKRVRGGVEVLDMEGLEDIVDESSD